MCQFSTGRATNFIHGTTGHKFSHHKSTDVQLNRSFDVASTRAFLLHHVSVQQVAIMKHNRIKNLVRKGEKRLEEKLEVCRARDHMQLSLKFIFRLTTSGIGIKS